MQRGWVEGQFYRQRMEKKTREAGGTRWGRGTHGWERSLCVRPWMAFLYVLEDMVARRSTRFRSQPPTKLCSAPGFAHMCAGRRRIERAMEMRGARGFDENHENQKRASVLACLSALRATARREQRGKKNLLE